MNREHYWRHRSNIFEWCTKDRKNTHKTQSQKWIQKKQHTNDTNGIHQQIHSFPFSLNQQTTRLEKEEQHHWVMHWNQTQHSQNSISKVNTKEATHKWHPSTIHFFFSFSSNNRELHWKIWSNIIEWCIEIKHNTHSA